MQLVEQHIINRNDPRFALIDAAAFKSKNLYNATNYEIRQAFIHEGKYLNYSEMQWRMQSHEAYKALPAKVSQQILMMLDKNFVSIPHARFIDMLTYKAALVGIGVEVREESYTSQASFLDLDPIPDYRPNDEEQHIFSGKRIGPRSRLYRTKDGRKICADVNGAYNILRKSKPDAFAKGTVGYVVHPLRLAIAV